MPRAQEKGTRATTGSPKRQHPWDPAHALLPGSSCHSQAGSLLFNHRIPDGFGGKRPSRSSSSAPCNGQGHLLLSQGAANPIQPGLGPSQGNLSAPKGISVNLLCPGAAAQPAQPSCTAQTAPKYLLTHFFWLEPEENFHFHCGRIP